MCIIMDLFRSRSILRNIQFLSFIFFLYPSMEMPSQKILKDLIRIVQLSGLIVRDGVLVTSVCCASLE